MDKILVCGDVDGNFDQLFKRVSTVNRKNGPFAMLLCLGDFFASNNDQWIPYRKGLVKVPLPTFVLGPNSLKLKKHFSSEKGSELAENVIHLGECGIYPCKTGLRIAYLSGKESSPKGVSYGMNEIVSLENATGKNKNIDILLTNDWPSEICNFSIKSDNFSDELESKLISRLSYILKPRYHFVGSSGIHFERLPYRNHMILKEPAKHVTRFISLAKVGNSEKDKWLYAFNIIPMAQLENAELVKQPEDTTEHPFSEQLVKEILGMGNKTKEEASQFFYDMNPIESSTRGKRKADGSHPKQKRKLPVTTGPCWFCLSSPEVEKHLVVSVGSHAYLALAKGGLVKTHLLIMPIEHFQSTADLESDCTEEIGRFKECLQNMCKAIDHSVVFFERNYRTQHLQIQAVPIPNRVASSLKDTFMILGEELGIPLDEIPKHSDISQLAPPGTPFFYVELPSGEKLFHRIRKSFPLQFGREALASPEILNLPEKIDWRECKLSKEEEVAVKERIRSAFKSYDFTLDSEDSD